MDARVRDNRYTELIDPACVADTFIEGIGEIERLAGNCVRVTLYASRSIGQGEREHLVVARLVMPEATFARTLRQGEAFLTDAALTEDTPIAGPRH